MPLNRKWHSMDFFGSHESLNKSSNSQRSKNQRPFSIHEKAEHNHHFPMKNPFRHRLASTGPRDDPPPVPGGRDKDGEGLDLSGGSLMQKCVIIQRDEKGYGFTVSGDNPVFVASVKQDGAAARAGVQHGDRIVKVNGTLVTQRNHLDVVKLIKSGSYVALTLLGKPSPTVSSSIITHQSSISSNRDSVTGRVTAPQPVNPDKDRELLQQKVHMTRTMYETAKEDFEKLQKQYVSKPSEKLHSQLLEKERTVRALDNQLKQLTGWEEPSPVTSCMPAANTSDLSSMCDSAQTSPSVSPTPDDLNSGQNGQDLDESASAHTEIIHIDDEEVNSEDDQVSDPGPFADLKMLESRPAHMAVLLNYLISNSDPSPVLFHIITDLYFRSAASIKELRKWAYEIFSTFIYKSSPLSIAVEDSIISQIDNTLASSGSRTDNENVLRNMFLTSRQSLQVEISELLNDFRNKKDLGMGNLYGIQKVHDNMDRASEVRTAEDLLMPHVKLFGVEDNSRGVVVDKDLATGWALATFLRSLGGPKSLHSATLDRIQTFMMKDKKSIKFPGSRSSRAKAVKGHQLTLQHFYVTTVCSFCGNLIWGVGYQGYQCQSCEMTLHKFCADEITEQCGGKKSKRTIPRLPLSGVMHGRRLSSGPQQQSYPATEQTAHAGTPVRSSETRSSYHTDAAANTASTQPYPREDDSELAGITPGHSVKSMISRYQVLNSPTGQGGVDMPDHQSGNANMSTNSTERRGSSDLSRSGSLNNKEVKTERPARRAKSDVDVDSDTFKAINQSGSSSASSLSSRSVESPGNSTDNVSDLVRAQFEDPDLDVEAELPPLKQVLSEDILRKLKPKEKKRQEVLNELFYTERAHLRNLKVLDLLFHRPMCQEKGIMMELARVLFPNIGEMISLHVSFVRDIKERIQVTPVKDVGDILLKQFDGEAGERFRKGCAEYCRNQAFALDALKKQTRKGPRLQQFLHDAESNSLCRRLQLKDLMPSQMQRLTKYPLLIDNLLKYTQPQSDEYRRLEKAHDRCKVILAYVNQAVKECENYHKLKDIEKRLDRRSIEGSSDPALAGLKNLDLTQHKLIFDGPLTWKLRSHRTLDMHVLLFEDTLVLLQKQDDRYVLKCQNTNVQPARDDKYTHFPILKLQNLLARTLATEKKSFFVVNISESRAQMYEFTAASSELRLRWCKLINDKADELKKASSLPDFSQSSHVPQQFPIERSRFSRISRKDRRVSSSPSHVDQPSSQAGESIYKVSEQLCQQLDIDEDAPSEGELIQPEEVSISDAVSTQSTPVSASLEMLRRNGEQIEAALCERGRLLAEVLKLSWDQYLALTAQQAQPYIPVSRAHEDEEEEEEEDKSSEFLLAKAMEINSRYIRLITSASTDFLQQQQSADDGQNCPSSSSSLSALSPGNSLEGDGCMSVPHHGHLQDVQAGMSVSVDQIKNIATEMNIVLTELASSISSGSEERHVLRQELEQAQQKLESLQQKQKQMTEHDVQQARTSPHSEPASTTVADIPSSSHTSTTIDVLAQEQAKSSLQQQEREKLTEKYGLEDETATVEEVYAGIHEATVTQLEESLELDQPTHLIPVIATHSGLGGLEIAGDGDDDDDDDDHEVSVADLPLPDLVSVPEADIESSQQTEAADVDDSETESDETDVNNLKILDQDMPGLATTMEDIDGELRELGNTQIAIDDDDDDDDVSSSLEHRDL